MNKRVFYLVLVLLVVVSIFIAKFYFSTKKEVLSENNYLVLLESKLKKVSSLKDKYKFNNPLFNRLKGMCEVRDKGEKYSVICKKLDAKKFNRVQNIIFKNNFKIEKFNISKESIEAEISK